MWTSRPHPRYAFEDPVSEEAENVLLSFIVADPGNACTPSWGAAYSLDDAGSALDLDRRVARLQQLGGTVSVSFGGLINKELATSCTDAGQLEAAYRAVVDRYNVSSIDLDIEGDALTDVASLDRRAAAVAALQQDRRGERQGPHRLADAAGGPQRTDDGGQRRRPPDDRRGELTWPG